MSDDRVELAALALCHSGKFACDGRCAPICFEFMGHKPKRCSHAVHVHGDLARDILNTLDPSIESLQAEVAELRKQRLMILTAVYPEAPKFVATICDESLDRSGALLGEVRELARQALAAKGETREHEEKM